MAEFGCVIKTFPSLYLLCGFIFLNTLDERIRDAGILLTLWGRGGEGPFYLCVKGRKIKLVTKVSLKKETCRCQS